MKSAVDVNTFLSQPNQTTPIADLSATVFEAIDSLQSHVSHISTITLTDASSTNTANFTLTAGQFSHDAKVLTKIKSPYSLTLSDEPAASVAAALKNNHVSMLAIVDSAANIAKKLNVLQKNIAHIGSIAISDTASLPTLTLQAGQLTSDAGILQKIGSAFQITIADSSSNISKNLANLESHAGEINSIKLTNPGSTLTINASQYNANIDALTEISGPYTLNIVNDTQDPALTKTSAFTMRAAVGTTGPVTLTATLSINGTPTTFTSTSDGTQSVQFTPKNINPKVGDSWNISVTTTNANNQTVPGQIEATPGFFGAKITGHYSDSLHAQFIGIDAKGTVTGLPGSYTATDKTEYILIGTGGNHAVNLAGLKTADHNNSVLHKYLQAGQVVVTNLDGATQPQGSNLASPSVNVNGNSVAVINDNFDSQQGAILVNAPHLSSDTQVEMRLTNVSYPLETQTLGVSQIYGGFSAPSALTAGTYSLYFTDGNGQSINGLQTALSTPQGGIPAHWQTAPTASKMMTLDVGTVSDVESYYASHTANTHTWYIIKDSIENIQNAGNSLHKLVASSQLLGAYVTDGFANITGTPSSIAVHSSKGVDYVRAINDYGDSEIQKQSYTVLALHTVNGGSPMSGTYNLQIYDNGQALGNASSISLDGTQTMQGILLPTNLGPGNHSLTAKLGMTTVSLGLAPAGGGLPVGYATSLNVWVGNATQLPSSLSAINNNTIYVVQDSPQNLENMATSIIESGVLQALSANGQLAFEVTGNNGGQLTLLQQQLLEQSNINISNIAQVTISDTLFGLSQLNNLWGNTNLLIHDDFAHLTYLHNGLSSIPAIDNALSSGNVYWADNMDNLLNASNQQSLQSNHAGLAGIVVSDSANNFENQYSAEATALQTLATSFNGKELLEVKDNVANLQTALSQSSFTQLLQTDSINVHVVDTVANLESSNFTGLSNQVNSLTASNLIITAKDSVNNLLNFLGDPTNAGLFTKLQNITVVDSAQNIQNALQGGVNNNNGINPLMAADNLVINDTLANVQTAVNTDQGLLGQVSKLVLTAGGGETLQISLGNTNQNGISALPEVVLSYMSGTLSATEAIDNNGNGTLLTISDTANHQINIDLVGLSDPNGMYSQGGWYHT